ncbi:MAG: hypothetical protein U9N36_04060 [Euryarchaeota archaeon]|nr:hypothetical protein [Euryarchaeota archaeon]
MDDLAKLERLFKNGYILAGPLIQLSEYTSESIERVVSFFNIGLDQKKTESFYYLLVTGQIYQ